MKRGAALLLLLALLCPGLARAHIGSPDVFFDGQAGPYPVSVTIRMPGVVPGRAQILVRIRSEEPVRVSCVPIASSVAVSNAPPPEEAAPVQGETNLFSGELWLMTIEAYSIEVQVRGKSGQGIVQVPVSSIARRQLPMPAGLGAMLLALGLVLCCGGIAVISAAAREAALPPEVAPGKLERRKYWKTFAVTTVIFALIVVGGKRWCDAEVADFRTRLLEGGWPDLDVAVKTNQSQQRVLDLKLDRSLVLAPDHGKLIHLFLARLPNHDAFAHLHPVRTGEKAFHVALPPLPEGDYEVLCDLTLAEGFSSTATNTVHLPAPPGPSPVSPSLQPDPDDSWAADEAAAQSNAAGDAVCQLPGGLKMIWKSHPALRAQQDAGLRFEVRDASGQPAELEPYMGMMSHAAVLRSDGQVFAHLHPSGNYSMAAEVVFDNRWARASKVDAVCGHGTLGLSGADGPSVISLPYQFPAAGDYRVWVQVKSGGQVLTAVFDAPVLTAGASAGRPGQGGT